MKRYIRANQFTQEYTDVSGLSFEKGQQIIKDEGGCKWNGYKVFYDDGGLYMYRNGREKGTDTSQDIVIDLSDDWFTHATVIDVEDIYSVQDIQITGNSSVSNLNIKLNSVHADTLTVVTSSTLHLDLMIQVRKVADISSADTVTISCCNFGELHLPNNLSTLIIYGAIYADYMNIPENTKVINEFDTAFLHVKELDLPDILDPSSENILKFDDPQQKKAYQKRIKHQNRKKSNKGIDVDSIDDAAIIEWLMDAADKIGIEGIQEEGQDDVNYYYTDTHEFIGTTSGQREMDMAYDYMCEYGDDKAKCINRMSKWLRKQLGI